MLSLPEAVSDSFLLSHSCCFGVRLAELWIMFGSCSTHRIKQCVAIVLHWLKKKKNLQSSVCQTAGKSLRFELFQMLKICTSFVPAHVPLFHQIGSWAGSGLVLVHNLFNLRTSWEPVCFSTARGAKRRHVITSQYTSVTLLRLHTPWRKHGSNNNKKKQQQQCMSLQLYSCCFWLYSASLGSENGRSNMFVLIDRFWVDGDVRWLC